MNMPPVQRKKAKEIFHQSLKLPASTMQAGRLASVFLKFSLLLLIFLNLQTFGEGFDFCYDATKRGYRLDTTVIKYVHAVTGVECLLLCLREDTSCRSINFRKTSNSDTNCEFLRDVHSEKPNLLLKDDQFDHYQFDPDRELPHLPVPTSTPQITQKPSSKNQELLSSCKGLLQKNKSLSNGVYQLRNTDSLEQYKVYCHMTELSGCGQGGWTLLMKIDGNKNDFNYSSPYWTNKVPYAVEDGLEGLNEKQTKLSSYWNTPFNKICLGMKVNGVTQWIASNYNANSLHSVMEDGTFQPTTFGKEAWKSLIDGSSLQENCNKEGFNIIIQSEVAKYAFAYVNVRIGLVANNQNSCGSCNSCIGFGTSVRGCDGDVRNSACGNIMAYCTDPQNDKDTAAFGYILVQ